VESKTCDPIPRNEINTLKKKSNWCEERWVVQTASSICEYLHRRQDRDEKK